MISENDIKLELDKLNDAAKDFDKVYEYRRGKVGNWALFEVHDENVYRPVYLSKTSAGFFAYISLLKNLYNRGKIGE
jgi:hypothetical protein